MTQEEVKEFDNSGAKDYKNQKITSTLNNEAIKTLEESNYLDVDIQDRLALIQNTLYDILCGYFAPFKTLAKVIYAEEPVETHTTDQLKVILMEAKNVEKEIVEIKKEAKGETVETKEGGMINNKDMSDSNKDNTKYNTDTKDNNTNYITDGNIEHYYNVDLSGNNGPDAG